MYHAAGKIEFQPFTVVLTADVFQLFIKLFIKKMRWGGTGVVYELTFPRNLPRTHGAMATRQVPVLNIGSSNLPGFTLFFFSFFFFFVPPHAHIPINPAFVAVLLLPLVQLLVQSPLGSVALIVCALPMTKHARFDASRRRKKMLHSFSR